MESVSRRRFLQSAAIATAATQIAPVAMAAADSPTLAYPENGTLIPDTGWRIWIDEHAAWQNDDLFLPEDVSWLGEGKDAKLCGKGKPLPINVPTGGWSALTATAGKEVVLPTTVEQHFWGKYGAGPNGTTRPYTPDEYRYAKAPAGAPADDDIPQNGAYFGVSWWTRPIDIPASMQGKRIFLHIRGARLRAEVYLNHQLVGYSIMEELPFECDLTHAANPGGPNTLAIRLTNPFGRFDWVDGANAKWGHLSLYRSHGFAGLDRGMTVSAHDVSVRIKDLWVLNTETKNDLQVNAVIDAKEGLPQVFAVFEVVDSVTRKVVAQREVRSAVDDPYRPNLFTARLRAEDIRLWDLNQPHLYHLRITAKMQLVEGAPTVDTRTIAFGFRSFTVDGIGTIPTKDKPGSGSNALFRLNGRRIRIYSSISWGFWGLNGLFPVPELAEKEVTAAKALGLNCLNFHRNLAKEDVLRAHDRLGLLRYMEPGAGKLAIGKLPANTATNAPGIVMEKPTSEADVFAQRFMFVKCVEMVKAYRSHPSVIEYCLQNEIGADLKNPATLAIIKAMHDEDPSRMVVLNDGFVARGAAQAWYEPWSRDLKEGKLHRSDEEQWGAFWNNHQGAGDQWYDTFYKSPTDYTYKAPYKEILTEYGEMEGCARPDNHPLMVHQIKETYKKYGGDSYDLLDHEEIISAYENFIAKWGFRKAFPTAESFFIACGRTEYESWQNYMENARISDELDFAAISGWESTAIENHSGIVDNLRNFKSDPELIRSSLLPIRPIAKQHSMCVGPDDPFVFDLFLANDTGKPATGELIFSVVDPKNRITEIGRYPVPTNQSPDQFSYLIAEKVAYKHKFNKTVPYFDEGAYTFKFALSSQPLATHTRQLWMTATNLKAIVGLRVAVSGISSELRKQIPADVLNFKPGEHYDLIITSGITAHTSTDGQVGETTGESMPVMKPGHVAEPGEVPETKQLGHIDPAIIEAAKAGTPLLVIPNADTLSDGCAQQLAAAGAFTYHGNVGDFRAPWMGNWYVGREHPLFDGMPTNAALGGFYQIPGRQSNGLLVEKSPNGADLEIVVAYSRDHDRKIGAGTFTTRLGKGKLLYHRIPPMHPVMQQRFLANAIRWLTT
jgi:beta-galactosidase